jgi:hypothetical protein
LGDTDRRQKDEKEAVADVASNLLRVVAASSGGSAVSQRAKKSLDALPSRVVAHLPASAPRPESGARAQQVGQGNVVVPRVPEEPRGQEPPKPARGAEDDPGGGRCARDGTRPKACSHGPSGAREVERGRVRGTRATATTAVEAVVRRDGREVTAPLALGATPIIEVDVAAP